VASVEDDPLRVHWHAGSGAKPARRTRYVAPGHFAAWTGENRREIVSTAGLTRQKRQGRRVGGHGDDLRASRCVDWWMGDF